MKEPDLFSFYLFYGAPAHEVAAKRNFTEACSSKQICLLDIADSTFQAMGHSASTSFITPTPKNLSWGCHKEDTVKLMDFLTQSEEDLWGVKIKQRFSLEKLHLTRSADYVDLAVQERFHPNEAKMLLNPAFAGDQGL
ncbi:hypothetical protein Q8A73_008100 [Channa argus]|nr:hypothetical protein Q8A73_008100 [Channa argus]